jgi:hypothetical protein
MTENTIPVRLNPFSIIKAKKKLIIIEAIMTNTIAPSPQE